jgi:hypothetical protein
MGRLIVGRTDYRSVATFLADRPGILGAYWPFRAEFALA